MPRPLVLFFWLLLIAFTFQIEWKQQIVNEVEARPILFQKQRHISKREESIKEKIILSQEESIQKLNELVRTLREQLVLCKGKAEAANSTAVPLTELPSDLGHQQRPRNNQRL